MKNVKQKIDDVITGCYSPAHAKAAKSYLRLVYDRKLIDEITMLKKGIKLDRTINFARLSPYGKSFYDVNRPQYPKMTASFYHHAIEITDNPRLPTDFLEHMTLFGPGGSIEIFE